MPLLLQVIRISNTCFLRLSKHFSFNEGRRKICKTRKSMLKKNFEPELLSFTFALAGIPEKWYL